MKRCKHDWAVYELATNCGDIHYRCRKCGRYGHRVMRYSADSSRREVIRVIPQSWQA